jgi:hypothetical protein
LGKIASDQFNNVYFNDLVTIGLVSKDSKYKTSLFSVLKKLPSTDRSTYSAIKVALDSEMEKIQERKDRLAAIIARSAARSAA